MIEDLRKSCFSMMEMTAKRFQAIQTRDNLRQGMIGEKDWKCLKLTKHWKDRWTTTSRKCMMELH